MDWFNKAKQDYIPGVFGYRQIAKKYGLSPKTVSSRFLDAKKRGELTESHTEIDLNSSILKDLAKECAVSYLCEKYKQSERVINAVIADLKDEGYDITEDDNYIRLNKAPGVKENKHIEIWKGEKLIRFGLASDTHLCSIAQQMTHLNNFYDICKSEGIKTVYHAGDIIDGDSVYPGHMFEVFKVGADKQKEYAVQNYPSRQGIKTKFIGGNHDLKWYQKSGYDVCEGIANERADLIYLGQYAADVELTPNCKLRLEHPLGKPAYAVSYKTQRKIDNMRGGMKPNILAEGHYHYHNNFFRRNVHAFCVPSFQGPTKFSTRLGLESDNGAYIIEISVDEEGTITKITPTLYPYYKIIEHDY